MHIDLDAIRKLESKRWTLYKEELTPLVDDTYDPNRPTLSDKAKEQRIQDLWKEIADINAEIWRIRGGN